MQISIEHHFKECEKENSLIKMLFMNCLILFLHCNRSLREMNADFEDPNNYFWQWPVFHSSDPSC